MKFADTELTGIPWRITVGPKGVAAGMAELTSRVTGETIEVPMSKVVDQITEIIGAARVPDGADPIYR